MRLRSSNKTSRRGSRRWYFRKEMVEKWGEEIASAMIEDKISDEDRKSNEVRCSPDMKPREDPQHASIPHHDVVRMPCSVLPISGKALIPCRTDPISSINASRTMPRRPCPRKSWRRFSRSFLRLRVHVMRARAKKRKRRRRNGRTKTKSRRKQQPRPREAPRQRESTRFEVTVPK